MRTRTTPAPSLDRLIRDLYASLSEQIGFEQPLHLLGAAFRSNISSLHAEDFGARRGSITLVADMGADEFLQFNRDYARRWSGQNLWMEGSLDAFRTQGYAIGEQVVGDREFLSSPFYRHGLKPIDIRHGLAIPLWSDDKLNMAVAGFHRGHGESSFDDDDIALTKQVRPHLVNVYAIYHHLARLEDELLSLRASFEGAPLGMLVLDGEGRILEANGKAHAQFFVTALASRTPDRHLRFSQPAIQHRFEAALRRLAAADALPVAGCPRDRSLGLGRWPDRCVRRCGCRHQQCRKRIAGQDFRTRQGRRLQRAAA